MLNRILTRLPVYLIWAMLSVVLWGYIFTFLTDAPPENKLSLWIDADIPDEAELAALLEEDGLPDGIRMVKVHSFSYAMFDESELLSADLYIVKASEVEDWQDSFRPLPEGFPGDSVSNDIEGIEGIRVYSASDNRSFFDDLIPYTAPGEEREDFLLFFGANSPHEGDGLDIWLARRFLDKGGQYHGASNLFQAPTNNSDTSTEVTHP